MSIDRITAVGALFALLAIAFFAVVAMQQTYPLFEYATPSDHYVDVAQNIGPEYSRFMWNTRSLDLVAQAFVILAAAAGSLAMLRAEEKGERE